MRASRQPLLLLDHVVTIPEASDCDLYKCKDTFPIFIAAPMLYSILQFEKESRQGEHCSATLSDRRIEAKARDSSNDSP